jgi:hypothetical protein
MLCDWLSGREKGRLYFLIHCPAVYNKAQISSFTLWLGVRGWGEWEEGGGGGQKQIVTERKQL